MIFCHAFHGGPSGAAEVKTYTFEDVVNTLAGIAPYDWRKFGRAPDQSRAGAPLSGLENSGWKLVFSDIPSDLTRATEEDANGSTRDFLSDSIFAPMGVLSIRLKDCPPRKPESDRE